MSIRRHQRPEVVLLAVFYDEERLSFVATNRLFLSCVRLPLVVTDVFDVAPLFSRSGCRSSSPAVQCCSESVSIYGERLVLVVTDGLFLYFRRTTRFACRHRRSDLGLQPLTTESDVRLPPRRSDLASLFTTESLFRSSSPTVRCCIGLFQHGGDVSFVITDGRIWR